jgi:hypothetical protein
MYTDNSCDTPATVPLVYYYQCSENIGTALEYETYMTAECTNEDGETLQDPYSIFQSGDWMAET